jgi:hypothetical protein
MAGLMDVLPGVAMPVEAVAETLAHMWDTVDADGGPGIGFRASQMNLLLHLGMRTSEDEAKELFATLLVFAQRYPCRILVLCPFEDGDGASRPAFVGKVFSQCYMGTQLRDVRCCEALILSFAPDQSAFLESQMSLWLEPDLPVINWFHRVPARRISQHYRNFINRSRRVLFDRAVEGDAYDEVDLGDPAKVRDLAAVRTLPLRQHFGQFLAGFDPKELVDGLTEVSLKYSPSLKYEAMHYLGWQQAAISKCMAGSDRTQPRHKTEVVDRDEPMLEIGWRYADDGSQLHLEYHAQRSAGRIHGCLAGVDAAHAMHIECMEPAAVLGEALFFG